MKKKTNAGRVILALIIILTALIIITHNNPNEKPSISIEKITSKLVGDSQEPVLDEARFNEIRGMDYGQLKEYFDVNKDFFIYMEDTDGRIILAKGDEKLTEGYCE